jgi:hypothetical protein
MEPQSEPGRSRLLVRSIGVCVLCVASFAALGAFVPSIAEAWFLLLGAILDLNLFMWHVKRRVLAKEGRSPGLPRMEMA